MDDERDRSSLDDETPGSQGEIESGSQGDFTGPNGEDEEQVEDAADETANGAASSDG